MHQQLATASKLFCRCPSGVNTTRVDAEVLRAMAEAGCVDVRFGIETGSTSIGHRLDKPLDPERTAEVIRAACDLIERVDLFFVWGLPFETLEDLDRTVFQMVSARMLGARIVPLMFSPLPQTAFGSSSPRHAPTHFAADLIPESVSSGLVIANGARTEIPPEHEPVFDLVREHPDIFAGFFHRDPDALRRKREVMEEFGFYPSPGAP